MTELLRLLEPLAPDPCPLPEGDPNRDEWLACAADPVRFCCEYAWIEDLDTRNWIRFQLWPDQADALVQWRASRRSCTLKARQDGFSWLALADALHDMTFRPIASVLIFSKTDREAIDMVGRRLCGMWSRLPDWMRPTPAGRPSGHTLSFTNGSRAVSLPTNAGQSYTGTLCILDEFDKLEGAKTSQDKLLAAVKPTVDASGRLVVISTAEKSKPDSTFKRIFRAGDAGGYKCLFYPWSIRPGRSPEWYEQQKSEYLATHGSLDLLWQEYPATSEEALASNSQDKRILPQWLAQCFAPLPLLTLSELHHLELGMPALPQLRVYRLPERGKRYVIGVDLAEGLPASDDTAFDILDRDSREQMASFAAKVTPAVTGGLIASVGRWYNRAEVLAERNNHGHEFLGWLALNASDVFVLAGHDGRPGWLTSTATKPILYDHAAECFRDRCTVLHDAGSRAQLAEVELSTLSAPEGLPDDRAVSYALALMAAKASPRGRLEIY